MNVIASLYAALSADAVLAALLDAHSGAPAIFSGSLAPSGYKVGAALKPCVMIGPIADDFDEDDFTTQQRFVEVRIRLYCRASASDLALDDAARRVRALIHRKHLPPPAGETFRPRGPVSGPVAASTSGPEIAGRQLTARLFVKG